MRVIDASEALPPQTLRLAHTDDPIARAAEVGEHRTIALHFPRWREDRPYSQAVLLRARLRWRGELIATGDVWPEMLPLLRRFGFDAVQLRTGQETDAAERTLSTLRGPTPQPAALAGRDNTTPR